MRDALSLLDQCIAFYLGQELTYDKVLDVLGAVDTEVFSKLLRKVFRGDVTGSIHILEELIVGGRELRQFVGDFTWYMRNLLLVRLPRIRRKPLMSHPTTEASEGRKRDDRCGDADALHPYFFGFCPIRSVMQPRSVYWWKLH